MGISAAIGVLCFGVLTGFTLLGDHVMVTLPVSALAGLLAFLLALSWIWLKDPSLRATRAFRWGAFVVLGSLATSYWSVDATIESVTVERVTGPVSVIAMVAIVYMLWRSTRQ